MRLLLGMMLVCTQLAYAKMSVSTYNIRNFGKSNNSTNLYQLEKIIENLNSEIIGVQEITDPAKFAKFIAKNFNQYSLVFSKCGGGGGQKLGILYDRTKWSLSELIEDDRVAQHLAFSPDKKCGSLRPALIAYLKNKKTSETLVFINNHLKAGSGPRNYSRRNAQYKMIAQIAGELKQKGYENIVIVGDLNTTGYQDRTQDYQNFQGLLYRTDLNTTATKTSCTSYWSGEDRGDNIEEASTLDHILYSDRFMTYNSISVKLGAHCERVKCQDTSSYNLGVSYQEVSDHCPVTLTFK